MALSKTTKDHDEIRLWAESRGAVPGEVASTESKGAPGILRFMFPKAPHHNDGALKEIEWDDFFEKFDASGLELIYQDVTSEGAESNFNKLIYPENESASVKKSAGKKAVKSAARTTASKTAAKKAASTLKTAAKKATLTRKTTVEKTSAKKSLPAKKTASKKAAKKTGSKTAARKNATKRVATKSAAAKKSVPAKKAPAKKAGPGKKTFAIKAAARGLWSGAY